MPQLHPTDPLFTPLQESRLRSFGVARADNPKIDLAPIARFECGSATYYVSDCDRDGRLFGVQLVSGKAPILGHFDRKTIVALQRAGRVSRSDIEPTITVAEIARIGLMRSGEA